MDPFKIFTFFRANLVSSPDRIFTRGPGFVLPTTWKTRPEAPPFSTTFLEVTGSVVGNPSWFVELIVDCLILPGQIFGQRPWKTLTLGGGFKYFDFHPYLGKWSNLTNIFQVGWNHQPVTPFNLVGFCSCDSQSKWSPSRQGTLSSVLPMFRSTESQVVVSKLDLKSIWAMKKNLVGWVI